MNNFSFDSKEDIFGTGIPFLTKSDLMLLIGCAGFCAFVVILVLSQRKCRDGNDVTHFGNDLPTIPHYFRWIANETEI